MSGSLCGTGIKRNENIMSLWKVRSIGVDCFLWGSSISSDG